MTSTPRVHPARLAVAGLAVGAIVGAVVTAEAIELPEDAGAEPVAAPTSAVPAPPVETPEPAVEAPAPPPDPITGTPCPPTARACVDLAGKRAWLQDHGRLSYGPVPITSGMPGYETPPGSYTVLRKVRDDWSRIFGDPMPNSVYFTSYGIAFHDGPLDQQSHGCIHLSPADSEHYFSVLQHGDSVVVY